MPVSNGRELMWDAAVRVLHWTLALIVAFNLVRDDGDLVHRAVGYVAVGVVLARWLWKENLPASMITGRRRPD